MLYGDLNAPTGLEPAAPKDCLAFGCIARLILRSTLVRVDCRLSANPPRKAEPQRGGEFAPLVLLDDRCFIRDLDHGSLVRYVIP